MGVVEDSRALYERYLDDGDRAKLDDMTEGDRAYFWTLLYYEMPRHMGRSFLDGLWKQIGERDNGIRSPEVPFPLDVAEESITPHGIFGSACRLIRG